MRARLWLEHNCNIDKNGQMSFVYDENGLPAKEERHAYKAVINVLHDATGDGGIMMDDVAELFKTGENQLVELEGDGDFRSEECIELLKEADIVCTNPPFSLFREYVAQLMEYKKDFLIIGNQNAITYKEIFPLLKDNKMWIDASIHSGDREFRVPNDYNISKNCRYDDQGNKYIRVRGPRWYTNLEIKQRYEDLICFENYTPEEYPKYDNYDAINVDKTALIPCDYTGVMGVPITFMDKYDPDQFEITDDIKGLKIPGLMNNPKDTVVNGKSKYARILIKYTDSWIESHPYNFETDWKNY